MTDPGAFDFYSEHAADYARYRPQYPGALFATLAGLVGRTEAALDVATGSGQAAVRLAAHFDTVLAIDTSAEQLHHAVPHPAVTYRVGDAAALPVASGSVDLITVAAAAHWLPLPEFYAEVRRVARPGAVLAVWSYGLNIQGDPPLEAAIQATIDGPLGPWWPERIQHIFSRYTTLPFPFEELAVSPGAATTVASFEELTAMMRTWSASSRFLAARPGDPIAPMLPALRRAWGADPGRRRLQWPLFARVGRVP